MLAAVRVGGVEYLVTEDNETAFQELQTRIHKTIDFLNNVKGASMDNKEDSAVVQKTGGGEVTFTTKSYLLDFVLPTFFRETTAYAILRHVGVAVGKIDYFGKFDC